MISAQYLILAREIKSNNLGMFTFVDSIQHFVLKELPVKGSFDMALICGPGWDNGKYHIHVALKLLNNEIKKIGSAEVIIKDELQVHTAIIQGLNLIIDNEQGFHFLLYKEPVSEEINLSDLPQDNIIRGELILERPFRVIIPQFQENTQP
jgi:hypothetical protein